MTAAHKNESPSRAGQFVKTLSKYSVDFINFWKACVTPDAFQMSAFCFFITLAVQAIVKGLK